MSEKHLSNPERGSGRLGAEGRGNAAPKGRGNTIKGLGRTALKGSKK